MTGRAGRVALGLAGFAVGIGLLAWCVSRAFSDEHVEELRRLSSAPAGAVAWLVGLAAASVAVNGLIFWSALRPARRVPVADVLAVNAVATCLGYLPMKLSLAWRVLAHHRRDGLPVLTIGAWLAAVAVLLAVSLGPAAAAGLWRGRADGAWAAVVVGGAAGLALATIALAGAFRGDAGLARAARWLDRPLLRAARPVLATRIFRDLHAGLDMLASPRWVSAGVALRMADGALLAARFSIAAAVIGRPLPVSDALMVASVYFVIGVVYPFGALGSRESGAAGFAALVGSETAETVLIAALVVGAADLIAIFGGAGLGLVWLGPTKLLARRKCADQTAEAGPDGSPPPAGSAG